MRALRLTPRAGDLVNGSFDMSSATAFYGSFLKDIPTQRLEGQVEGCAER